MKAGGRVQMMTGINGYWAIANSHPQFDGCEQDIETDKGLPVKAVCKVYRKDRKFPSVGIALMAEYQKGTPIWKSMPSVMLMKCAESVALRKAFPQELNGLYTQEEMPPEFAATAAPALPARPALPPTADDVANDGEEVAAVRYAIPQISTDQQRYLEKRGAYWDDVEACWVAPRDLGPKLAKYKVGKVDMQDDLPGSFETPLGEQIDGGAEVEGSY